MPKIILIIICLVLTIVGCLSAKNQKLPIKIKQGIDGYVYKISGNQMPSPNSIAAKPNGIATTIYIYDSTNIRDVVRIGYSASYSSINKKLITSVESDSTGHFFVALPVGSYSLFIKVNNVFYSNLFDIDNNISLTKVTENNITHVVIKQTASAVF